MLAKNMNKIICTVHGYVIIFYQFMRLYFLCVIYFIFHFTELIKITRKGL